MSLKNVEKPEVNVAILEISVAAELFEAACQKAYRKNVSKFQINGFRKGKAPRHMIERIYGPEVFYEDAIDETYPAAYEEALKESGLKVISRPECNIQSISKEEGYVFTAKVTLMPEIKVGCYQGIEAVCPEATVSDEEVDAEIEARRQKSGRLEEKEGEAALGDTVVIDYEGFVDGTPFDGGKGEQHNLKLGSNSFIPGFEDQLVGKKSGEECHVDVTFPEDYHAEELAGKAACFKVVVHSVKSEILPDIDDEFAKDVSDFETLAEYKADTAAKLLESKKKMADNGFEGAVIDKIVETIEGEIPEIMYEEQLDRIVENYSYRFESQGMPFENYLKMTGSDIEGFRKDFRPQAERNVKSRLALEYIAKAENLQVSDEDVEAEYKRMSDEYGMEIDRIRAMVAPEDMRSDLLVQKAVEFVKNSAIKLAPPAEAPAEEEKAPAVEESAE